MSTDLEEFFSLIWQENEGKAVIARLDSNRMPTIQHFFSWPEQADKLYAFVERHHKEDLYTCPTLFSANSAMKIAAKHTSVVYGDADTFDVTQFRVPPTVTVYTSPGKTHVYWVLDDTDDPFICEQLAHGVVEAHPKDATGYDTAYAMNKLLRVPGSYNRKPEYTTPYKSTWKITGPRYTVAEFAAEYEPVESARIENREMGDVPSYAEALDTVPSSITLNDLLQKGFDKGSAGSEALWLLYKELFRLGATDEQTFAIAKGSKLNKFARDGRRDADQKLWEDILRARVKDVDTLEDYQEDLVVTVEPGEKPASIDFLTTEEKESLPRTFIDEYVDWASAKTDADPAYHVAGACSILSAVFSDFGHAVPEYGELPLNLWFMVLGSTTMSRKTTARKLMLKVLRALQDDEIYSYDLGSEFTAEGLDNALLGRSYRSAFLWRDEIQDFMQEVESKAYLAGIKGRLTALYDGEVSGKLRATGDNKKKPPTKVSLVLFAMGIRDQLAEYLTVKDFESGFLTRFLWVEGKEKTRSVDTDYLRQQSPNKVREGDTVFMEMVRRLEDSRTYWEDFVDPAGPTVPVPCTEEAWERMNLFITKVLDAADSANRGSVVQAASHRLYTSIIKLATLLAMYDQCNEVQLPHMLAAIDRCGIWFLHMVSMADSVSESHWKKRLDKLDDFITTQGGEVSKHRAYSQFKSELKPREFTELIQALEESGSIKTYIDSKTKKLFLMAVEN